MVSKKTLAYVFLIFATLLLPFTPFFSTSTVQAEQITYHVDHEWAKIWINQDGTIDLLYDIKITVESGSITSYVEVGQPVRDFTIGEAWDERGNSLQTEDVSSGEDYRVRVYLKVVPVRAGESVQFNLTTNVGRMIWEDEDNPGNVGIEFTPAWWVDAKVNDVRVLIVLPKGVTNETIRYKRGNPWKSVFIDPAEDDRLVVYWEGALQPKQEWKLGVSFPKGYVAHYERRPSGWERFLTENWPLLTFLSLFIGVFAVVIYKGRKRAYLKPLLSMETLGIRRGLTAVEASQLLGLPPTKIVTEILYSLLMKRAVWVTATTPALKLQIMEQFQDKTGTSETPLRYYERSFLRAVRKDGTLSEEKLAETVMLVRDGVENKLRGYCRRDTIEYYRSIVSKAWEQVEQAGTPELASKAYDENLLWLILDKNFQLRTQTTFRDKTFEPGVDWWWYWYAYTHYHPHPTYTPSPTTTQPTKPPTIPGAEFANNVATAIEKTANNIVLNMEKFANSIVPSPPPSARTSRAPAHHRSSCVCACASCACVCACVSCACACASGGVG